MQTAVPCVKKVMLRPHAPVVAPAGATLCSAARGVTLPVDDRRQPAIRGADEAAIAVNANDMTRHANKEIAVPKECCTQSNAVVIQMHADVVVVDVNFGMHMQVLDPCCSECFQGSEPQCSIASQTLYVQVGAAHGVLQVRAIAVVLMFGMPRVLDPSRGARTSLARP